MSNRVHHAQLVSRRVIARDTEEYRLALSDDPISFRPGQFISVQVGTDADGNPDLRSYSIASSPDPSASAGLPAPGQARALALILRLIEDGVGSRFFSGLTLGDRLRFTGPMGFFVNELAHPGDVVYGATGTGITPIVPMLRETLARDESGAVHLHWGLRSQEDLFWQDELAELARHPRLRVHLTLSRPAPGWTGAVGRISDPIVAEVEHLRQPIFYLCGNGQMIEEVKARLRDKGVDRKRQIRTEAFFD